MNLSPEAKEDRSHFLRDIIRSTGLHRLFVVGCLIHAELIHINAET